MVSLSAFLPFTPCTYLPAILTARRPNLSGQNYEHPTCLRRPFPRRRVRRHKPLRSVLRPSPNAIPILTMPSLTLALPPTLCAATYALRPTPPTCTSPRGRIRWQTHFTVPRPHMHPAYPARPSAYTLAHVPPRRRGPDPSRGARHHPKVALHRPVRDRHPAALVRVPVQHVLLARRRLRRPHPRPRVHGRARDRERVCLGSGLCVSTRGEVGDGRREMGRRARWTRGWRKREGEGGRGVGGVVRGLWTARYLRYFVLRARPLLSDVSYFADISSHLINRLYYPRLPA